MTTRPSQFAALFASKPNAQPSAPARPVAPLPNLPNVHTVLAYSTSQPSVQVFTGSLMPVTVVPPGEPVK